MRLNRLLVKKLRKERFMKNTIKLLGIIALIAMIGLSMVGCDDPEDPSFTLEVVNSSSYDLDVSMDVGGIVSGSSWSGIIAEGRSRSVTTSKDGSIIATIFSVDYRTTDTDNLKGGVKGGEVEANRTKTVTITNADLHS